MLETEFFPFVIRPARYIGNELGSIHKSNPNLTAVALAFCDVYDVGMSYPSLHNIYRSVNAGDDAVCERAFAPDCDAEKLLRDKQLRLFSLESYKPLSEFDLLLALVPGELCLTNLLTILDLAGVGIRSSGRNQTHPLVGAVVPSCFNPEPIADFVDFVILGAPEATLDSVIKLLPERQTPSRSELLRKLSQIAGIYVPSLYQPEYAGEAFVRIIGAVPAAPMRVGGSNVAPHEGKALAIPIVPFEEIAHEHLPVELAFGAGHNCRVCPALGSRDGREADPISLANSILEGLNQTGFDELTLMANWSADYRHFDRLLEALADRLRGRQIKVSLPPLRPSLRTFDSIRKLSVACGKQSLSFLLEAGSDRLRETMGRYFSIDEFYRVVANSLAAGWHSLKLHFVLGLPTETRADVDAIIDIVRNCVEIGQEYGDKAIFHVALAPYIPRSHTRWQWERQISVDDYLSSVDYLRRQLRSKNAQVTHRHAEPAYLEGALARGDRRVGTTIIRAYELGCRFDNSNEQFDFSRWQSAFADVGLNLERYLRQRAFEEVLPWDHLYKGVTKDQLARDCQEARRLDAPARTGSGSFKLGEILLLKPELVEQILAPTSAPSAEFGRKPKRRAEAVGMVVPRSRVRLLWSKEESGRFVGHLATMRVFERAIRRAELPVGHTQGFHPRQKLAFGPPLTLGYTSRSEYLDIQLETPFQQEMISKLNRALPSGYQISQGRPILGKATSLSSLINTACYEVMLPDVGLITPEAVDELLSRETIIIRRIKGEETREVDIRKSVANLELRLSDSINILYMELTMGNLGFVKPEEILGQCLLLPEKIVLPLRVCRTELLILINGKRLTPFEVD
ncbi:MAG: TIGR03936 family radical SAM-associated protein [candidate division Zixibacteria bacterium]|nr:TIGR03936 family radical SAM-associated protein [candidate division Zixibacteria bacterium]